jgi:hypothetical protein
MPSDVGESPVRDHLKGPIGAFRSAVALTREQVRGFLAAQQPAEGPEGPPPEGRMLGAFAAGRIDVSRFASLLARAPAADPAALACIEDAYEVLREEAEEARIREVHAEPAGDLRDAVARALASVGRAFGAARVFELARTGRYREAEHRSFLDSFPFPRWSRQERMIAPPLVVHVSGRNLRAEPLAEFLDGAMKLVLVVTGEAPLVPLVRLVTPGTFVLQAKDPAALDRFAAFAGPGIAAILPEGSALFAHDPALGADSWDRLRVELLPETGRVPRGGRSARQEAEEVHQLQAMAARPPGPPPVAAGAAGSPHPVAGAGPADRLAAWLLAQADLKNTG